MSSIQFPVVNGLVMRVTKVDPCGAVIYGDGSRVVSDGFVSIAATMNIDDGNRIAVVNAAGVECVAKEAVAKIQSIGIVATFCKVDPDLYTMMTGQPKVIDPATGDAVGFQVRSSIRPADVAFALEVWSEVPGAACAENVTEQYGYLLFPLLQGGVIGDFTIENGAVTFQVTNVVTKDGSAWAEGPYNVVTDALGDPAGLQEPIQNDGHMHVQLTTMAPPATTDGAIPLDDPDASAATGATAGSPGSFTPASSNRPDDLTEMTGVTATPSSAWTTGQHVVTESGEKVNWNGTAWETGEA